MVRKNWQALPVSATTVTVPNTEDHAWLTPEPTYAPLPDTIQWPTAHLSSEPDIVELHKNNHDEPNEPRAETINICDAPPLVKAKKRLQIIQQQGLLDQFSFSSSSMMIGGAVLAGLVFSQATLLTVLLFAPYPQPLSGPQTRSKKKHL